MCAIRMQHANNRTVVPDEFQELPYIYIVAYIVMHDRVLPRKKWNGMGVYPGTSNGVQCGQFKGLPPWTVFICAYS